MFTRSAALAGCLALGWVSLGPAQDDKKSDTKLVGGLFDPVSQVKRRLAELKAEGATVEKIDDKAVRAVFPDAHFVSVRFPLWPVARVPPEPLKSQNLFAVAKGGKLEHLTDAKALEKYFKAHLKLTQGGKDALKEARPALHAWLLLTKEFVQDGYYKFALAKQGGKAKGDGAGNFEIWGSIEVVPEMGNKGAIQASLAFDKEGKLVRVTEENKVVRGIRPRCQATRLLDPDPVIRAICEQDLLVLGLAARDYLMEQRASAGPELRQAIDRLWQRILHEGR
jgi:hypothetical protein